MNKICCFFDGDDAVQSWKNRQLETVRDFRDSYRESLILFRCQKCGGLILYEYEETAMFIPGEDWDNAYCEKQYYPIFMDDMKEENGEISFNWRAMQSRKHMVASYRELDEGDPPFAYVEARKKEFRRKEFSPAAPAREVFRRLPASERDVEGILTFIEMMQLDPKRPMVVRLPRHDDPREIRVSYHNGVYSMELAFPMDDFGWSHPLVLRREGLTYENVRTILTGILLEKKDTDQIPEVMNGFRDITDAVYGTEE